MMAQSNEEKSELITFNFYDSLKFFKVEFETDSIQRNRMMTIELEGFNLDITDFIDKHHDLYIKLKNQMQEKSKHYWQAVNIGITGIPTLDYPSKENKSIGLIKSALLAFLFCMLLPIMGHAQDTIYARKAYVSNHVELSRKTGKILRAWPHWVTVKSGKIVDHGDSTYTINGKEYFSTGSEELMVKKQLKFKNK